MKKKILTGSAAGDPIPFSVLNPAAGNVPVVYIGIAANLNVSMQNQTGGDIILGKQSSLLVFMPSYYKTADLKMMTVTGISQPGWTGTYDSANMALLLTFTQDSGTWSAGAAFNFTIGNAVSSAAPTTDSVLVSFNNLKGSNIPAQVTTPLTLNNPVVPTHVNLGDYIQLNLEDGGAIFVSVNTDALTNTLFLNLKNTGATPLYNGDAMWKGNPKITVSFVYGNTSGSLAPGDKSGSSSVGSAWNISGSIPNDTNGWVMRNPQLTDQGKFPIWEMTPTNTNKKILDVKDKANETFAFGRIVSFTNTGHTQMYVQFSGFTQNENTVYNDQLFIVDISKQSAPNPNVLGVWTDVDLVTVNSTAQQITIPITWSMFGVGSVKLSFYIPGMTIPDQKYSYGTAHPALNYDTQNLVFTGLQQSQRLSIYCWGYSDNNWQYPLNKRECSVPLVFPPKINSFTIDTAEIVPPASYAFILKWDVEGAASFQITSDDGSGPQVVPVPKNVTSYVVNPVSSQTIYTLNVYANNQASDSHYETTDELK